MHTVVELVLEACRCSPDAVAIEMVGDVSDSRQAAMTYRELADRIDDGARVLSTYISPTTKFCERCIAILDSDSVESVSLQLSLMKLGFSFINVSKTDSCEISRC